MAVSGFGTTNYLTVGSTPITAVPLTLVAWFNSTSIAADNYIVSINEATDDHFALCASGNQTGDPIRAATRVAGTESLAATSAAYSANVWTHAAAVFDITTATDRTALINGGSAGTNTTNRTPTGLNRISIGIRDLTLKEQPMNGQIAEVAIYNTNLSTANVAILAGGMCPLRVLPQNLVAYWPLYHTGALQDLIGGRTMTITGSLTNGASHPRIFGRY